ncbi:MAG TPA: hypothetical protein VGN29_08405 [Solirubrobacteraceae bacterium]|nr:hypothetical protein [Solirubrobacteraceae bacterium]
MIEIGSPRAGTLKVVDEVELPGWTIELSERAAGVWRLRARHETRPTFETAVLSRREPGIDVSQWPLVTYVDDVRTDMTEAKPAADDKKRRYYVPYYLRGLIRRTTSRSGSGP